MIYPDIEVPLFHLRRTLERNAAHIARIVAMAVSILAIAGCAHSGRPGGREEVLFDGRTFAGWEGDTATTWRIEDGALAGGSLSSTVPRNEFVASSGRFTNFVLRVKFRLTGSEGFVNGGVQIRSERTTTPPNEMKGYQCDIGEGWWGALYDESRRNKVLVKPEDSAVQRAIRKGEWNDYVIRCEGRRIQSWINEVPMIDYTEPDETLPQHGRLGLQVHGGGKTLIHYKDISIQRLP